MAEETVKMNLQNNVTIGNANGVQTFRKGMSIEVPKAQADDIARIDYNATEERNNLMKQRVFGGEVNN